MLRRVGCGRIMSGRVGEAARDRRRSGREAEGVGGSRVRIGVSVGDADALDSRGKREVSPRGRSRRISDRASSVSCEIRQISFGLQLKRSTAPRRRGYIVAQEGYYSRPARRRTPSSTSSPGGP